MAGATRTVDSHAYRLRRKLNAAGDSFIVNVWGVGYRLIDGGVEWPSPPLLEERGHDRYLPPECAGARLIASSVLLSGWAVAVLVAWIGWRHLGGRMEAVARACHELRGPLTAARLGLELGARDGPLSSARLAAIELELDRASLALDDLSCRRSNGTAVRRVEQIDLVELLRASVEAWRGSAAATGTSLRLRWTGCPAHVWGDRLRLAQATGNLLANAIEHGGGSVEVRGRLEVERRVARIEVLDEGPGLRAPVLELSRGARGGRGRRGRGLAIATAIAGDHGGRIAAAPSERGARLVLELPAGAHEPLRDPVSG
jgi:signal transduction histidine kinase